MRNLPTLIRRLAYNDKGAIALIFGLLIIPLILAVGVGIDYARAVQFKTQLQAATDDSALAGASAYVASGTAGQTLGTTAATNYMNNAITALPHNNGVTFTVTPGTTSSSGNVTAFQMTVTAVATFPTTLMSIWQSTMTITTSATANNPIVDAKFDTAGFTSSACDANTIYWYIVPSGGGIPAASAMNQLWTNNSSSPTSTATFQVAASQQIGFALQNVTGGRSSSYGGCTYGGNGYGTNQGNTQWFYSSLQAPSSDATTAPGGASTGSNAKICTSNCDSESQGYPTTQDCSLQVIKGTGSSGTTFSSPLQQCFTSNGYNEWGHSGSGQTMTTEMTNAVTSCSNLAGNTYEYAWNDMGGTTDDWDYNDLVYQFSCSGGSSGGSGGNGTTTTGVTLTQ
jgi:Flp pilus assembly protein TadG